ncbi:MAG: acylphosphatase [Chloroflexota bacterium]|nr:acylphosphatase [Chloroflexota bacterium]
MTEDGPTRLYALVHGRVQGVYFRAFVQRHASTLRLAGWARNMPDGASVEVVAEGLREALDALLGQLRWGPPGSRVDSVEESWMAAEGLDGPFQIR